MPSSIPENGNTLDVVVVGNNRIGKLAPITTHCRAPLALAISARLSASDLRV